MLVIYSILALCLCQTTWSQNDACSYTQYVPPGMRYRLNSPGYPNRYTAGTNCSWYMATTVHYAIRMSCSIVNLPWERTSCYDFLLVSTTGDLRDGIGYCTPFQVTGSEIRMQLISSIWAGGGSFACDIISEQSSMPSPNQTCSCGWSYSNRIVGGTDTGINEFPSMALLLYVPYRDQWCGATIISKRVALTAAHCFSQDNAPQNYGLLIGEHDTTTRDETNATILLKIINLYMHDDYMPGKGGNDIALVETDKEIQYTARIGPACLPGSIHKVDIMRKSVTITGWGTMSFGGKRSDTLQKVSVNVVPDSSCESAYGTKYKAKQHICTFYPGKDACQFDSGGPLYYYTNNRYIVVGIVSYGSGCASDLPSLNVNVENYLPWIQKQMPGAPLCYA